MNAVVVVAIVAACGLVAAALEWLNRAARGLPVELRMRPLQRRARAAGAGRIRELSQLEALADAAARGDRTALRRLVVRLDELGVVLPEDPSWSDVVASIRIPPGRRPLA